MRGVSSYDTTHAVNANFVYELPFGRGKKMGGNWNRAVDGLLGGWQLTMINTLTSGLPVNITYSPTGQFQVSGLPSVRPNQVGPLVTPEGSRTVNNYLDKNGVAIPTDPAKPFGTLARNAARGYGLFQLDLGLHKEFGLTEKAKLQGQLIDGRFHGIAVSCYLEGGGSGPRENVRLVLESDGTVSVYVGSSAIGQGIETVFAQIAADSLEMPMVPSIISASRLEMARPRPVPPYRRVVEPSACVNA